MCFSGVRCCNLAYLKYFLVINRRSKVNSCSKYERKCCSPGLFFVPFVCSATLALDLLSPAWLNAFTGESHFVVMETKKNVCCVNQPFCPVQVVGGAWLFSRLYCNIFVTLDVMMCTASILNLCAISIDRWVLTSSVHSRCLTDFSPLVSHDLF